MKPRWRWWLFCAMNAIDVRYGWRWARRVWAWSILPEWIADPAEFIAAGGEAPF